VNEDINLEAASSRNAELEAELKQARARINELEAALSTELRAILAEATAHADTLRRWNAEIEAAGGEETFGNNA
jgi:hypothetical protein